MKEQKDNMNTNMGKYVCKYILLFVVIIFLGIGGLFLLKKGLNNYKEYSVNYIETRDINYKVYLQKNDFFDQPYLGENQVYITSLIDNLDIDFNYDMQYSDFVTGKYVYYIRGVVSANIINDESDSYWSKEYRLTDEKEVSVTNENGFNISENIVVDYQKYNELLGLFKKAYGLSTNGNLKIELVIQSNVNSENLNKDISVESTEELNIPLSQLSVEATIDADNNKTGSVISEKTKSDEPLYLILKITGIIVFACDFLLLIGYIYSLIKIKINQDLYVAKLRKILSTYDSIIINSKALPNYKNQNIIKVESFEELMDAHGEVRMPINFIEKVKDKESMFMLISPNCVWVYDLNAKDFSKKKNKKKIKKNEKKIKKQ